MNTRKRLVASFTAAILMAGGLALAAAAPASAHTPEVDSTCETLNVKLTAYEDSRDGKPNNVTVTIDGIVVDDQDFGQSFTGSYDFDDEYEAHDYVVKIDAKGTRYDKTVTGSSVPCEAPPLVKDATAELTVTPPTCDVPAKLVLGRTKHATWGTPTATDGPASYSVTATATKGHLFASGDATQVFTGELAGVLDPNKEPCYIPPVIPDEPEPVVTSVDEKTVDCAADTVTTVTTTTTTGWNYDEETNTWIESEPVVTTSSVTRDATDQECPPVPVKPEPIVTAVDNETVDCTSKTVTTVTTTTTTDWVYDEESNTWVEGEPSVTTASVTRDATATECPTIIPPVTPATPAAASEKLASTGFDSGWLMPFAALLLAAGIALPFARRLRHQ